MLPGSTSLLHRLTSRERTPRLARIFVVFCGVVAGTFGTLHATAAVSPVTPGEVEFMLRGGLSSDEVLREVAARRLAASPDTAAEGRLAAAGAAPALLAALRDSRLVVGPGEVKAALVPVPAPVEKVSVGGWGAGSNAVRAKSAATTTVPTPALPALSPHMADVLHNLRVETVKNGRTQTVDSSSLGSKRVFGLYFSAHWCGPCRRFTPELVKFYQEFATAHPEFELVFVSKDRSAREQGQYIQEMGMPWPVVPYARLAEAQAKLPHSTGESIPCLLLVDSSGQVLSDTHGPDGSFLGPKTVLRALTKLFPSAVGAGLASAQ